MSVAGVLARIDDRLNPIVVKELRQAVQGRVVTAVLMTFLLLQVVVLGAYLVLAGVGVSGSDFEAEHGRTVFGILQGILLVTCLLFLPLYTGVRLGAERSDTNVDLLFITTLRPRAIISGKLSAALILALLIFSACAPFMTFTYLLRGLDLFSIVLVLAIDFMAVVVAVQVAIFFGSIPAHWLVKIILGLFGLFILLVICGYTIAGTVALLWTASTTSLVDSPAFWAGFTSAVAAGLAEVGLFFTWSVAMVSPPSANRALPSRVWMLVYGVATGVVAVLCDRMVPPAEGAFLFLWVINMARLCCLQVLIGVNEREGWGPRVARTIPRNWLLRPLAFLFYSGSAGGVLFAGVLFGLTWLGAQALLLLEPVSPFLPGVVRFWTPRTALPLVFEIVGILFLYVYGYALTAVLLRRLGLLPVRAMDTWIVAIFLMAVCSMVPLVMAFVVTGFRLRPDTEPGWFLTNPVAAAIWAGHPTDRHRWMFFVTGGSWAALVTLLNLPWFWKQVRRFRPYAGSSLPMAVPAPVLAVADDLDATQTAPGTRAADGSR